MIDLHNFCSRDPKREALHRPFTRDGFTYATNGHLLIEVPPTGEEGHEKAPKNLKQVMSQWFDGNWMKVPEGVPDATVSKCRKCGGSGQCVCNDCDNSHTCGGCDGLGEVDDVVQVRVCGVPFSNRMLLKIATLPNVRIAVNPKTPEAPMAIRFDGGGNDKGRGLLMPMKPID